jgi:hypothetical protein
MVLGAKPLENLTFPTMFQDTTAINSNVALNIKNSHEKCTFNNVSTAL